MKIFREPLNIDNPHLPVLAYVADSNHHSLGAPIHIHDEMEFVYVISGKMVHRVQAEQYTVDAGEILFVNALSPHSSWDVDPGHTKVCVIQFHPRVLGYETESNNLVHFLSTQLCDGQLISPKMHVDIDKLRQLILDIVGEIQERHAMYDFFVKSHIYSLVAILGRNNIIERINFYQPNDLAGIDNNMARLLQYIDEHFTQEISVESISNTFNYDYHYFCRMFKRKTGKTFSEYMGFLRIHTAEWLLITTDNTVSDIGNQIGYSSHKSFLRAFKKKNNMIPTEYRRRLLSSQPLYIGSQPGQSEQFSIQNLIENTASQA